MQTMSDRQYKVCRIIHEKLGYILLNHDFADPLLHNLSWTITDITISPDLKIAKIYVVANGHEQNPQIMKALSKEKGRLKKRLSPQLSLRYMPDLRFFADDSFSTRTHIDNIIKNLRYSHQNNHEIS